MSNPLTITPLTPTLPGGPSSSASTPPVTSSSPVLTTTPTSTAPTSTTPSTSAATTASTTSTPSTTQSTSSTLSSTSSTQTTSSASTTSPTTVATTSTTPTVTPSPYTSTSNGVVVTSYAYVTASSTPSSSNNTATSSNSFFSNTGAVAGVFTVVGLIVVAIFVALVTNAVRRRRAKKFDRDVAEAAVEAAASSRSPFDDYTYSNNGGSGGGGGGGYPYSDTTHGTFVQAPMGLPNDTYGMSEMTQYDPYAAGAVSLATANVGRTRSRQDSESQRTPGIAGVGAGNLAREPSRRTPYHAFAGPGPQPHEMLDHTASGRYRSRGVELLEGAGLAGTGVAAMAAANNGAFVNRRPSEYTQQTHGSMRSQGHSQGHSSNENYPAPLQPGYQSPPRNDTQYADAYTGFANPQPPLSPGSHNPHGTSPSPPPAQSHSPVGDMEGEDYQDEDYGQHNRVLRVANE